MGKLQIRRGVRANLPNPLDSGELGWITDTKQLYMGTGVANENVFIGGSPATEDYCIFLATTALGGTALADGATGLLIEDGVTTGTTANKLVNGNATFTDALVDKTIYNSTDGTWAKITAVDSATVLSLSADIMASGESYDIADAVDDLEDAYSLIPSTYGVNITLCASNGTHTYAGAVSLAGKSASGAVSLTFQGAATGTIVESTTTTTLTFGDNITINKTTFSHAVITNGAATFTACSLTGNLTSNGTLTLTTTPVGGNLVANDLSVLTNSDVTGSLTSTGGITLDSTNVTVNIIAYDSFTNVNGISVGGNVTVYGACSLDTAVITGYLTTYDTLENTVSLDITGALTANGRSDVVNLAVGGAMITNDNFTCTTDLDVTGDLTANGVTTAEGTITVGGNFELNGSWIQTDSLDVTGNFVAYGEVLCSNVTIGGNLETRENFTQTGTLAVTGTWYSYGISTANNVTITGLCDFFGKLYLTGTNVFNGKVDFHDRFEVVDTTFNRAVYSRFGGDGVWTTCTITDPYKLYVYSGSANRMVSGTYTIGNDPQNITNIGATITKGYTMYVASATLGGTTGAEGLEITAGTATSTSANNLVDTAAAFTDDLVGKTVYNSTDDTWAKINSVTNGTTLALSVDIMASGEAYSIVDAISTITLAVAAIPGQYNCDTTIKVSGETFREQVTIEGKTPSGDFQIYFYGTMVLAYSGTFTSLPAHLAANGQGSWGTWADTAANFTTSSGTPAVGGYVGYLLRTVTASQTMERIIDALPSATTGRICGVWSKYVGGVNSADIPANGAAYKIYSFGTRVTGSEAGADTTPVRSYGFWIKSKGITIKNFLVNYTASDAIRFEAGSTNNYVLGNMIHDVTTTGVGGGGLRFISGSLAERISGNWIYSNVNSSRAIRNEGYIQSIDNNRIGIVKNSAIECSNGGVILTIFANGIYKPYTAGVNSTFGGSVFLRPCNFIYATVAGNGFNANYNSIAFSSTATAFGTLAQTEIKNSSAYGARATDLSRMVASGLTYTTNTSGTYSADATTFGYVS